MKGGGEEAVIEKIKGSWVGLQERMKNEDGTGERETSLLKPLVKMLT